MKIQVTLLRLIEPGTHYETAGIQQNTERKKLNSFCLHTRISKNIHRGFNCQNTNN